MTEDIAWTCAGCGETGDRNTYATMVTTATGEVVEAEDGRVVSIEPQFPVVVEHFCFPCYEKKYKAYKILRIVLGILVKMGIAMDEDMIEGGLNVSNKISELVEYISGVLPREEEAIDG